MWLYGSQLFGKTPKNLHIIQRRRFFPQIYLRTRSNNVLNRPLYVCDRVWGEVAEIEMVKAVHSHRDGALK
jgi:hypothetical protein